MELPVVAALFVVLLGSGFHAVGSQYVTDEETLRSSLFTSYNPLVRPEQYVEVYITLVPLSLNNLDISEQLMSFTSVFLITWYDTRLPWNPNSHNQITDLNTLVETVWTPTLVVENEINNVGRVGGITQDNTPIRIRYTGEMKWYPPLQTTTSCEMKIYKYPFDTQTCYIVLTGWATAITEVNLIVQPLNFTYYSPNGEWEFVTHWTSEGSFYDGTNEFKRVFIHFSFRRRWQFYGQNLLMPIVLTSLLMCFVFALPIESGEKVGYALTVLLSYVVFLTWVTDNLPAISNDTSILQIYLAVVLCLGVLATLMTCWVLHLYHREPTYPMSNLMRSFVTRCLVPLRDCACCKRQTRNTVDVSDGLPMEHGEHGVAETHPQRETKLSKRGENGIVCDPSGRKYSAWSPPKQEPEVPQQEEEITWQEVASMFDRLFFILYLFLMLILSVTVLILLYNDYD